MTDRDLVWVSRTSRLVCHFPDVWQVHQSWLRDIVASRSVLLSQFPTWQAGLIFRWRLLYFVAYVGSTIVSTLLSETLKRIVARGKALIGKIFCKIETAVLHKLFHWLFHWPSFHHSFSYIFQRTATLLAVVELTLAGISAFTGILIAFYYQPAAMGAHESLTMIEQAVSHGSLILSLHNVAGNGLIAFALMQLVVMFLGRAALPAWIASWISGILLTLTAIGLSWSAIVLNWEQTGFWRFKVELSIVASVPWIGPMLRDVLAGGGGINSLTLQHMYTIHSYVLAIAAILLSLIHLTALILQEQHWKPREVQFGLGKWCNGNNKDSSVS